MTLPTTQINTGNLDAGTDSAAEARADLLAAVQALNLIISHGGDLPGTIKAWAGMTEPANHLPCNGTTRSRTGFAGLYNAITKTVNGNTTSGSPTISSVNADLTSIVPLGCPVSGPGIPAGAFVIGVTATTVKISANATATASAVSVVFAPWGVGDGSTTFTLPDLRGRTLVGCSYSASSGLDVVITGCSTTNASTTVTIGSASLSIVPGMMVEGVGITYGTTVAAVSGTSITLSAAATATGSALTLRFFNLDGRREGAVGGDARHTLTTAEMPSHTHTGNGRTDRNTVTGGSDQVLIKNATANALSPAVNATGDGRAHNNVQPSAVVNYIIRY